MPLTKQREQKWVGVLERALPRSAVAPWWLAATVTRQQHSDSCKPSPRPFIPSGACGDDRTRSQSSLHFIAVLIIGLMAAPIAANAQARAISCLGRLEPGDGVRRIASPAADGGVIAELQVVEGDWVSADQILATLTSHPLRRAEVARSEAELENAVREATRLSQLSSNAAASKATLESAEIDVRVARAALSAASAQLELSVVRSPMAGQVLEIHARRGERVGPQGILELGATDRMYAVAEVYETDIGMIKNGQSATIKSPALEAPLHGTVDRIGLKVGRMDVLGTDPIAKADARVVEVRIRLEDAALVAALTNLQVEIEIAQ